MSGHDWSKHSTEDRGTPSSNCRLVWPFCNHQAYSIDLRKKVLVRPILLQYPPVCDSRVDQGMNISSPSVAVYCSDDECSGAHTKSFGTLPRWPGVRAFWIAEIATPVGWKLIGQRSIHGEEGASKLIGEALLPKRQSLPS